MQQSIERILIPSHNEQIFFLVPVYHWCMQTDRASREKMAMKQSQTYRSNHISMAYVRH
jgi:hypothetical protein